VKVTGRFHDMGAFTADIAALSRIVTLNNIAVSQAAAAAGKVGAPGALVMEATAKTFRYLDPEEQADQKAAKNRGGKK
jgi:type IV pilus assembly protein PilO